MTGSIRRMSWKLGVLSVAVALTFGLATAAFASAGWTHDGKGTWVLRGASGIVQEVRLDSNRDNILEAKITFRPNGSVEWVGLNTGGGSRIDTWVYAFPSGARYALLDKDENGRYEVHGYDAGGDGFYELVRTDSNGDGQADTWRNAVSAGGSANQLTIPSFGTSLIHAGDVCDNSMFSCNGGGLQLMSRTFDPYR
jgi:hypothetical protein